VTFSPQRGYNTGAMTAPFFPRLSAPDDYPALTFGDRTLTYGALARACSAHAAHLAQAGVQPGERVAVWTHPSLETMVALTANALAGVVSVPLNPGLGARELEHVLRDAAPVLVLAADPEAVATRTPSLRVERIVLDTAPRALGSAPPVTDDPLLVLYTSGTTGAPKGAVLTARNVASNVDGLSRAWAWSAMDTLVHALPLFHVHGLALGLFGTLRVGGTLRWLPKFSPESVAAEFAREATMLFAVPTMYHRLADAAERDASLLEPLRSARLLVSGSAALPVREHARIERATGQRVVERYGLTETLINCAIRHDGGRRPGYVGPALDGVQVRLVDDARMPLDVRDDVTLGEVAVRGPNVFAGYLNRPEATAALRDEEGWFYTGDLATMAADGYVRIVGRRATDLIKTGGFKVGAGEVEAALLEHEAVGECAVVGVADEDLGERIVAYVVPRAGAAPPTAQALADYVAGQLAPHKRPRAVEFVEALPRNAMGKVLKGSLRGG
jgi:malonyl-CoA/methylmalonyl-CoA synthetase